MNLVVKEFCACNVDEDATLVLSQFAGAAAQLGRAASLSTLTTSSKPPTRFTTPFAWSMRSGDTG